MLTTGCSLQPYLPAGAAASPVILATDKTQLTQFSGNKSAYPVYLTLGNIPRAIRRRPSEHACILLGYLPVSKVSRVGLTKREHKARTQRIFHAAMRLIVSPLIKAGKEGIEVTSGDGCVCPRYSPSWRPTSPTILSNASSLAPSMGRVLSVSVPQTSLAMTSPLNRAPRSVPRRSSSMLGRKAVGAPLLLKLSV